MMRGHFCIISEQTQNCTFWSKLDISGLATELEFFRLAVVVVGRPPIALGGTTQNETCFSEVLSSGWWLVEKTRQ